MNQEAKILMKGKMIGLLRAVDKVKESCRVVMEHEGAVNTYQCSIETWNYFYNYRNSEAPFLYNILQVQDFSLSLVNARIDPET